MVLNGLDSYKISLLGLGIPKLRITEIARITRIDLPQLTPRRRRKRGQRGGLHIPYPHNQIPFPQ
ncbi:hypothetical protein GBA52_003356 [Prunus armeniaca]|nr:hypothetical protein GBA52_003356 [Prunus armeniaca]